MSITPLPTAQVLLKVSQDLNIKIDHTAPEDQQLCTFAHIMDPECDKAAMGAQVFRCPKTGKVMKLNWDRFGLQKNGKLGGLASRPLHLIRGTDGVFRTFSAQRKLGTWTSVKESDLIQLRWKSAAVKKDHLQNWNL